MVRDTACRVDRRETARRTDGAGSRTPGRRGRITHPQTTGRDHGTPDRLGMTRHIGPKGRDTEDPTDRRAGYGISGQRGAIRRTPPTDRQDTAFGLTGESLRLLTRGGEAGGFRCVEDAEY
jgi:hypothetical protein